MEKIHIDFWSNNSKIRTMIRNLRKETFNNYISYFDPTRLNKNNVSEIAKITKILPQFSNLCDEILNKVLEEDLDVMLADINKGLAGGIEFKENICLLCFCDLPIRPIVGCTWKSNLPISAKFTFVNSNSWIISKSSPSKRIEQNYDINSKNFVPLIIPIESQKYVICEELNKSNSELTDILLFPGKIRFTTISIDNQRYVVGIYESSDLEEAVQNLNNVDIYDNDLTKDFLIDNGVTTSNIIEYLTHIHTKKVQIGYYASENSTQYDSFIKHGLKFKVNTSTSLGYYELLPVTRENMHIPMEEFYLNIKVPLYIRKCNLVQGSITKPIPLNLEPNSSANEFDTISSKSRGYNNSSANEFDTRIMVDIRVLDLNFIWMIQNSDDQPPKESCFFLSKDDKTYISYFTHLPGILFAVGGILQGNSILYE